MSDDEEVQEMTELYGPLYPYSDHKRGETIEFMLRGRQVVGEILWVMPPGQSPSGKRASVCYIVGVDGESFFSFVYPSEVIQ